MTNNYTDVYKEIDEARWDLIHRFSSRGVYHQTEWDYLIELDRMERDTIVREARDIKRANKNEQQDKTK